MSETSLSTSLVTGRALILLQLLSRLLTFGLNQALVRLAPPEVFGTAAIQFDLICSTILFLSREGVRNALLRASGPVAHREDDPKGRMSAREAEMKEHALATLPLYLGILISILVAGVYTYTLPDSTARQADFHLSLALYVLSALLELAIEPLHIRALRSDPPDIRTRVQAEGGMAIVKAVVTVGTVVLLDRMGKGRPLLAFALGQMAGVGWLAGRYAWKYGVRGCLWVKVPKG
jgi:oligosaccharide translocation protein RFT1